MTLLQEKVPRQKLVRILIVDDCPESTEELSGDLSGYGFRVESVNSWLPALDLSDSVDVILLDVSLPGVDGFELCRAIRSQSQVPVIIVSSRGDEFERVLGLRMGADDYVLKPYAPRELVARIQAVARRASGHQERSTGRRHMLELCGVRIDMTRRAVAVEGREVSLTRKEFDLLSLLVSESGEVVSRDRIMTRVWGHDGAGDLRTLGVHVCNLRKKLGKPGLIETVRGVGLRLCVRQPVSGSAR
ncbi:response regulator transcription factor [Streptomyces sp. RerS4]|uniref:response regulator transcription factor n=1 Tax=Streptomyces sp. RerS4 TaxID=2942449 RepID=UPI00201C8C25|nr:response regulator transcription factor [Streptomyces sp. RerS4]UQX03424.1 response regulator transcription factor [Streptomyces sp. RerS4]